MDNLREVALVEIDKLKKWLDLAQQYQTESFWKQIFEDKNVNPSSSSSQTNPFTAAQEYSPKSDIYENNKSIVVEIEIPGLRKEDVQVEIRQQTLTITGEFRTLVPSRKYFLKERPNRIFKKELSLPFPVHLEKSISELKNGILIITMPMNHEEIEDIPILFDDQMHE